MIIKQNLRERTNWLKKRYGHFARKGILRRLNIRKFRFIIGDATRLNSPVIFCQILVRNIMVYLSFEMTRISIWISSITNSSARNLSKSPIATQYLGYFEDFKKSLMSPVIFFFNGLIGLSHSGFAYILFISLGENFYHQHSRKRIKWYWFFVGLQSKLSCCLKKCNSRSDEKSVSFYRFSRLLVKKFSPSEIKRW